MKAKYYLFGLLMFVCNFTFSQIYQLNHWDGYLSIKVKNDSNVNLKFPQEGVESTFDTLISSFEIYEIKRVFSDTTNESLKRCYQLRFSDSARMDTLINRLKLYPFLEYISKSGIGKYYDGVPDDSKYRLQWAMQKILADSLWHLMPGDGTLIKIGVIDDAFLLSHEDLAMAIDTNYTELNGIDDFDDDGNGVKDDSLGYDFADNNNDVMPPVNVNRKEYSHGTHAAMIAAGVTNNDMGIASFNRGRLKIIPIKNAKDNNWAPDGTKTATAMDYAVNMGAKVVSMSFEASDSVNYTFMAARPNIIFVVAAGNSGNTSINTLGSYNLPNVFCIGASNPFDEKAQFSNFNDSVDITAPGTGILSGLGTGTEVYDFKSGTSYATPLVAGLCAALWSYDSTLTAQQVIDRIKNTADNIDFENPAFVGKIGQGRINAHRAFNNITTQPHQAGFVSNKARSLCVGSPFLMVDSGQENYSSTFSGRGNPTNKSDISISKAWQIRINVVKAGLVRPFSIRVRFDLSKSHLYANSTEEIPLSFLNDAIRLPSLIKNSSSLTPTKVWQTENYLVVIIDHIRIYNIFDPKFTV